MARASLVVDASVGVKWFVSEREASLEQALLLRRRHLLEDITISVPDLFYYEVTNAMTQKKTIPVSEVRSMIAELFALDLRTMQVAPSILSEAIATARAASITVYDAIYVAVARSLDCPLVTANPRHQGRPLGCQVIPIDEWRA